MLALSSFVTTSVGTTLRPRSWLPAAHKLATIQKAVGATPKLAKEEKPKAAGQDETRVAELAKKLNGELEKLPGVPRTLREQAASLAPGLDELAANQAVAAARDGCESRAARG